MTQWCPARRHSVLLYNVTQLHLRSLLPLSAYEVDILKDKGPGFCGNVPILLILKIKNKKKKQQQWLLLVWYTPVIGRILSKLL